LQWAVRTFGGTTPKLDPAWQPPPLNDDELALARAAIAALETYLAPVADRTWLAARIDALLQHGWLETRDPVGLRLLFADWMRALAPFPQWAIGDAAAVFLVRRGKKGIAEMVAACSEQVGDAGLELAALRRLVNPPRDSKKRRRAAAWNHRAKRSPGFTASATTRAGHSRPACRKITRMLSSPFAKTASGVRSRTASSRR
jgi:hypothetical protein